MRPIAVKLQFVLVLGLLSLPAAAQETTDMYVEGYVFHYGGNASVAGVHVSLYAPDDRLIVDKTTTDINGFYQLRVPNTWDIDSKSLNVSAMCSLRGAGNKFILGLGTGINAAPVRPGLILRRDIYFDRTWRDLFRKHSCGAEATEEENPIMHFGVGKSRG